MDSNNLDFSHLEEFCSRIDVENNEREFGTFKSESGQHYSHLTTGLGGPIAIASSAEKSKEMFIRFNRVMDVIRARVAINKMYNHYLAEGLSRTDAASKVVAEFKKENSHHQHA